MALPKLDNTQIEKNQQVIIQKMDGLNAVLSDKLVPAIEKMSAESTVDKMFPFVVQIADNIYNIAGKLEAQVTSMKEVRDAIEASKPKVDEGAQIEQQREAAKSGKEMGAPKEQKTKTFWDRLAEIFDKVLIPLIAGFVIGFSKAIGGFESTIGRVITIFAALYLALSGFRKKVNELLISGFKKVFGGSTPKAPKGTPQVPGAPGQAPGTPDAKPGKPSKPPPSGLDKFLEGAKKIGKSIKDLFVGIADTIKQVLGKLSDGIKQFITKVSQGIKALLQNIAKGIESFGKTSVLKGAAALVVVSGALYVAAKAFKEFGDVSWEAVGKGIVAILGLVGVAKLLEKSSTSMIKGAFALGVLGGALMIAGKAFEIFTKISWEDLAKAGVAIVGLGLAVAGLGLAAPLIIAGSVAFGAMSAALVVFAAAVNLLAKGLPALSDFITQMSTLDGGNLILAAGGITALGVALAALGAGQVLGALGNFAAKLLSFGDKDIFTKLTELGAVAKDLNQLPDTIKALGDLSNFKVSNDFMKNVDILSAGLKKIAESAKGFEKTGDSLTALAKIAEVMNKPAGGTATGGPPQATAPGKPGAAPGKPAGKPAGKAVAYEGELKGFSTTDYKNEIAAEEAKLTSEGVPKAMAQQMAVSEIRAKVSKGDIPLKGGATFEGTRTDAKGNVTPVPATNGQQITTDSQKVAAAQGGGSAGGGQTNIVAPQSSMVNASQNQTINSPLNAFGIFGGRVSQGTSFAAF